VVELSLTWTPATESKEAKETRRQFNALLKHMTKLLDEESSSEDIHAAASLIYASLSNADADLNKSKFVSVDSCLKSCVRGSH